MCEFISELKIASSWHPHEIIFYLTTITVEVEVIYKAARQTNGRKELSTLSEIKSMNERNVETCTRDKKMKMEERGE